MFDAAPAVPRSSYCQPGAGKSEWRSEHDGASEQHTDQDMRAAGGCLPPVLTSSKMTILWRPGGNVTFFLANILMVLRTVSIPL